MNGSTSKLLYKKQLVNYRKLCCALPICLICCNGPACHTLSKASLGHGYLILRYTFLPIVAKCTRLLLCGFRVDQLICHGQTFGHSCMYTYCSVQQEAGRVSIFGCNLERPPSCKPAVVPTFRFSLILLLLGSRRCGCAWLGHS